MKARPSVTAFKASGADNPASSRSRISGPKAGSVMFWLATTPTLARTWAQRAATAGEEDEITIPNCPVREHRATSEKVIFRRPE
jgi:hypothetical protein